MVENIVSALQNKIDIIVNFKTQLLDIYNQYTSTINLADKLTIAKATLVNNLTDYKTTIQDAIDEIPAEYSTTNIATVITNIDTILASLSALDVTTALDAIQNTKWVANLDAVITTLSISLANITTTLTQVKNHAAAITNIVDMMHKEHLIKGVQEAAQLQLMYKMLSGFLENAGKVVHSLDTLFSNILAFFNTYLQLLSSYASGVSDAFAEINSDIDLLADDVPTLKTYATTMSNYKTTLHTDIVSLSSTEANIDTLTASLDDLQNNQLPNVSAAEVAAYAAYISAVEAKNNLLNQKAEIENEIYMLNKQIDDSTGAINSLKYQKNLLSNHIQNLTSKITSYLQQQKANSSQITRPVPSAKDVVRTRTTPHIQTLHTVRRY